MLNMFLEHGNVYLKINSFQNKICFSLRKLSTFYITHIHITHIIFRKLRKAKEMLVEMLHWHFAKSLYNVKPIEKELFVSQAA